jgi:hypothetical protein
MFLGRMTRIKRNPSLGWEIFKIESKQMRDICLLKFVTSLVMHYVATDNICKVKTVYAYSISIHFSKFGFLFILIILCTHLDKTPFRWR